MNHNSVSAADVSSDDDAAHFRSLSIFFQVFLLCIDGFRAAPGFSLPKGDEEGRGGKRSNQTNDNHQKL